MMLHGANIYKYARELDCEPEEILDFSSNINCYQPEQPLNISNAAIVKYADTNYTALKNTIAKEYQIDAKEVALFNGATAAIYALMDSLKAKSVYLYAPLYGESIHQDCSLCQVPHHRNYVEKHFDLDWAKIMKVCEVEQ